MLQKTRSSRQGEQVVKVQVQAQRPGRTQSSGPAKLFAEPELKMPGLEKTITMHYVLAAELRVVLERCWPGLMPDPPDFVRCRSRLRFDFLSFSFFAIQPLSPYPGEAVVTTWE